MEQPTCVIMSREGNLKPYGRADKHMIYVNVYVCVSFYATRVFVRSIKWDMRNGSHRHLLADTWLRCLNASANSSIQSPWLVNKFIWPMLARFVYEIIKSLACTYLCTGLGILLVVACYYTVENLLERVGVVDVKFSNVAW